LLHISEKDQLKFVLCNKEDYQWSKQFVLDRKLSDICEVIFSPVADEVSPTDLAEWILEDQLHVRMQIQLHKLLWGNKPGV